MGPLHRLRKFLSGVNLHRACRGRPLRRARLRIEVLEPRLALSTGGFDLGFSADGKASLDFNGNNDTAQAVAVQPDGKIVVVGSTQVGATDFNFAIARFNRDGTPDTTFNGTGRATVAFDLGGNNSDQATAVAIDSLGRIVVGGSATSAAGDFDFAVSRLTSAGVLDTTFDGDGKQTVSFNLGQQNQDQVNALALQADGKIVLAGQVQRTTAGDTDFGVVRLSADGSPDTQFSLDGKTLVFFDAGGTNADTASAVAIQADGMIVVAGTAATATDFEFAVTRILTNGTPDPFFGVNGRQRLSFGAGNDFGNAVAIQPDGRIVVAGSATGPTSVDFGVARLSANGVPDATFDGDGRVLVPFDLGSTNADIARAVTVQPDGKIVVAGQVTRLVAPDTDMGVARLNANGSLDTSFDGDGKRVVFFDLGGGNVDDVGEIALSAEGIVVAGSALTATGFDFAVTRLIQDQWVIVSADAGGPPTVKVFTPTGTLLKSFNAFPASFRGGVRVAAGDINGDQVPDIFCAPGPGMAPLVKIFDGRTFTLIRSIMVYAPGFKGGVNVAVADVQGDATLELITAPGAGIAPTVKIFNPTDKSLIGTFQAYAAGFKRGVRVATGDTDGNALREIIVAPQSGSQAVRIFDAAGTQLRSIQAFPTTFTGGVFIAAGSIDSSGRQDIVIAPGPGGGASVRVFEGSTGALLQQPAAYNSGFNRGIRAGTVNADGDALADVILAPGRRAAPTVKIRGGNGSEIASFDAFGGTMTAGLFVVGVAR